MQQGDQARRATKPAALLGYKAMPRCNRVARPMSAMRAGPDEARPAAAHFRLCPLRVPYPSRQRLWSKN